MSEHVIWKTITLYYRCERVSFGKPESAGKAFERENGMLARVVVRRKMWHLPIVDPKRSMIRVMSLIGSTRAGAASFAPEWCTDAVHDAFIPTPITSQSNAIDTHNSQSQWLEIRTHCWEWALTRPALSVSREVFECS